MLRYLRVLILILVTTGWARRSTYLNHRRVDLVDSYPCVQEHHIPWQVLHVGDEEVLLSLVQHTCYRFAVIIHANVTQGWLPNSVGCENHEPLPSHMVDKVRRLICESRGSLCGVYRAFR